MGHSATARRGAGHGAARRQGRSTSPTSRCPSRPGHAHGAAGDRRLRHLHERRQDRWPPARSSRRSPRAATRCGGVKLTGVAALRDPLNMADHGAVDRAVLRRLWPAQHGGFRGHLAPDGAAGLLRCIVEPSRDGPRRDRGRDGRRPHRQLRRGVDILTDPELRQDTCAAHVLCANDLVAAWGGVAVAGERNLKRRRHRRACHGQRPSGSSTSARSIGLAAANARSPRRPGGEGAWPTWSSRRPSAEQTGPSTHRASAAIVGGTGYGGMELLRLARSHHPQVAVTVPSPAGTETGARGRQCIRSPARRDTDLRPSLTPLGRWISRARTTCVFFATPHGVSAKESLRRVLDAAPDVRVVDLSGDLPSGRMPRQYEHALRQGRMRHPDRLGDAAAYGAARSAAQRERHRRRATWWRIPGCHAIATLLALWPLAPGRAGGRPRGGGPA